MQVRLYSDYPFPWRKNGGPQDEFERMALIQLRADPNTPVHQVTEMDGRPVLRFAQARLMKASCIECHNNHPDTPRNDWKEGDVRGVLEIIRPLDRDTARTEEGLAKTWLLLALSLAVTLGLSVCVMMMRRPRPGAASDSSGRSG